MRIAMLLGLVVLASPCRAQESFINGAVQWEGESTVSAADDAAAQQVSDAAAARREADWAINENNWMKSTLDAMQSRQESLEQTVQYLTAEVVAQKDELERQTDLANAAVADASRANAAADAARRELAALKASGTEATAAGAPAAAAPAATEGPAAPDTTGAPAMTGAPDTTAAPANAPAPGLAH